MITCVTGSNGFIGSNLVKKLINSGHEVKALVLKGTNEEFLQDLDCEIIYGDIMKKESLKEALNYVEVVYHLAAIPSSAWTKRIFEVNYEGTRNVFELARKEGVRRFVYMSSLVVHGFKNFKGENENTPIIQPKWYQRPYIKSKIMCERFLKEHDQDLEIVIIRPGFTIFGPNDLLTSRELIGRLDEGKNIPNVNKGEAKMSYVYVENLTEGLLLAGTVQAAAGETFLIADDDPPYITMKAFNNKICKELGRKPNKGSIPYWLAFPFVGLLDLFYRIFMRKKLPKISTYTLKVARYDLFFHSSKARKKLGYEPETNLDQAIKKTVKWYNNYYKKNH